MTSAPGLGTGDPIDDLVGVLGRVGIDVLVVGEPDGGMGHVALAAVVEVQLAGS
jgi:hypothetical protein